MGSAVASDFICSFCRKPKEAVAKLISSPGGHPRAYICDECVAVCAMIIDDDRTVPDAPSEDGQPTEEPHPLVSHPLTSRLLTAVERWIRRESLGADAAEDIAEVRSVAGRMMAELTAWPIRRSHS